MYSKTLLAFHKQLISSESHYCKMKEIKNTEVPPILNLNKIMQIAYQ